MIEQYRFAITDERGGRILQNWSYRLYSWLMEQLPPDLADRLHEDGSHAITQNLRFEKETRQNIWTVNLLKAETLETVRTVLQNVHSIPLHEDTLRVSPLGAARTVTAEDLLAAGRESTSRYAVLNFVSPCAFKQAGHYTIFPQEELIFNSLVARWNETFPTYALTDEEALQFMRQGLRIVDYTLYSTRFKLKGMWIPAFMGDITLKAGLALPLTEIWNTLLAFAPYSGIGIKTTLGMGAAKPEYKQK